MPLLDKHPATPELRDASRERRATALFPVCANPECASGWLHVWRSRTAPILEGGWSCSARCTQARIKGLVRRESQGQNQPAPRHRHRIPIGLVLLDQGWITHDDLRKALDAQRNGEAARLGAWLMANRGLDERRVTQALSIQWNCPILALDQERTGQPVSLVPRLFMDTFDCLPLRLSSAGILYLAFEDRIDHSLTLAVERLTGLRVEAGLLSGSDFRRAHASMPTARFPRARIVEAVSAEALANALTRVIEKEMPAQARVVRVHGYLWLRLWKESSESTSETRSSATDGVEDVICSLARFQ